MTRRRSLSPSKRLAVFERDRGLCYLCGLPIQAGEPWDAEHVRALALDGEDDEKNLRPAHRKCHAPKTKDDLARISKAKRQKAKTVLGIRKPPRLKGKPFAKKERAAKMPIPGPRPIYREEII